LKGGKRKKKDGEKFNILAMFDEDSDDIEK